MAIIVHGVGSVTIPLAEHESLLASQAAYVALRAGVEEQCAPGPSRPTKTALRDLLDQTAVAP